MSRVLERVVDGETYYFRLFMKAGRGHDRGAVLKLNEQDELGGGFPDFDAAISFLASGNTGIEAWDAAIQSGEVDVPKQADWILQQL